MGFSNRTALATQFNKEAQQGLQSRKVNATAIVAGLFSFWPGTGNPGVGSNPTIGKANGRVCDRSTTGAIPLQNAASGKELWLYAARVMGTGSSGANLVMDRVSDVQVAGDEPTGALTGVTATSRLEAAGSGIDDYCMCFGEATAATTGGNTYTLDYVDADGASKTTPTFTTATTTQVGQGAVATYFWIPPAADSRGFRSLTNLNKTGGAATGGSFNIVLARPILWLPPVVAASSASERDLVSMNVKPRKIWNDSCLMLLGCSIGATASSYSYELAVVST